MSAEAPEQLTPEQALVTIDLVLEAVVEVSGMQLSLYAQAHNALTVLERAIRELRELQARIRRD